MNASFLPLIFACSLIAVSGCASSGPPSDSGPEYPGSSELFFSGFSGLDMGGSTFSRGVLYLRIMNPSDSAIEVVDVDAYYLDDAYDNNTKSGLLSRGEAAIYEFDFSGTVSRSEPFWLEAVVTYDVPDEGLRRQISRGFIISGLDEGEILSCMPASFRVISHRLYFGTRVFSVNLMNTGNVDLTIDALYRHEDGFVSALGEPLELGTGKSLSVEYQDFRGGTESVMFVSDECPGAYQVITSEEIAGL